jgi:hypothetical protein
MDMTRRAKTFAHLVQRRIGFATGLRQRIKIAHHGFDNLQRINGCNTVSSPSSFSASRCGKLTHTAPECGCTKKAPEKIGLGARGKI